MIPAGSYTRGWLQREIWEAVLPKIEVPWAINKELKYWCRNKREYRTNKRDCMGLWVHECFAQLEPSLKKTRLEGSGFCEMAYVVIKTLALIVFPTPCCHSAVHWDQNREDGELTREYVGFLF